MSLHPVLPLSNARHSLHYKVASSVLWNTICDLTICKVPIRISLALDGNAFWSTLEKASLHGLQR